MSFRGSVAAMLTSLKNNKVRKREPRQTEHFKYVEGVPIDQPLRFKGSISKADLEKMRTKLGKRRKREKILTPMFYTSVITAAVVFIIFFVG